MCLYNDRFGFIDEFIFNTKIRIQGEATKRSCQVRSERARGRGGGGVPAAPVAAAVAAGGRRPHAARGRGPGLAQPGGQSGAHGGSVMLLTLS